jgi:hypothetical protein
VSHNNGRASWEQVVDEAIEARFGAPSTEEYLDDGEPPLPPSTAPQPPSTRPTAGHTLRNYTETATLHKGKKRRVRTGRSAGAIAQELLQVTGGWPRRIGNRLFAPATEDSALWLDNTEALFAWIGRQVATGAENRIRWAGGEALVTRAEFFAHLQQTAQEYQALEGMPHEPALVGHYYLHPEPRGGDGKALAWLVGRFCPATPEDAALLWSAFLTLFWGGPAGQRPIYLIDSEEDDPEGGRGVGKTKFGQAVARLAGGHIDARPQEDFDKLMTRLLSPAALDRRVVLLDNVKLLRFSWADLEALVTADVISGRALYQGEARRPNTLLWIVTLNRASVSKDLAQRSVPIRLKRPPHDPRWEEDTWAFIDRERWAIVGDILAQLRQPAARLERYSRWSAWEQAVLARLPDPAKVQTAIRERQTGMDDDQAEADLVKNAFAQELRRRGHLPDEEAVWIPAAVVAEIVNTATGEKRPVNKAGAYLRTLSIHELRRSNRGHGRGWLWQGHDCPLASVATDINDPITEPTWAR